MNCPRCNAPTEEATLREFGGVCPKCLLEFSEEKDAPAFPNLEIIEMLGQGGMGVVYKARQKNLDRLVALKVLSPHLSEDPEFVERFTREAKALAQLSHPNIVGIHDSGIHDRVPYLLMEYIDGTPLRKLLGTGKITPEKVLELIPQICDALQYAHAHGVIHRDIKPENILVDRAGRVKIADFGLAKLASVEETRITKSGYAMGSPHYMAPEQLENSSRVDHRADIYSLGVVFYEMLTGELPLGRFKAPSDRSTSDRRLDPVVLKSLEREPEDRWQSADEVKERITNLDSVKAVAPPLPETARPSARPLGIAAATLVLLTIAMGLSGQSWFTTLCMGFAALVCGIVALFRLTARRPSDPDLPPSRLSKIAFYLMLSGLGLIVLSFILFGIGLRSTPAELLCLLGCVVLLASMVTAVPAIAQIARRPREVGGLSLALSSLFGSFLILAAIFVFTFASGVPAMARPVPPIQLPVPSAVIPLPPPAAVPSRHHHVKQAFTIDELWPGGDKLPAGFEGAESLEGAELLKKAGLPSGILADLEYSRGLAFQKGNALMIGLQFRTELARRRWQKEPFWEKHMDTWHYHLFGDSQGVILIRHNGSAHGAAAKDMLEAEVEKLLAKKYPGSK